jgi:CheY-like chemotaxis protein
MQDRVTSSWRRRSDLPSNPDEKRGDENSASSMRSNAEKLEAWEGEGGTTGSVSSQVLRILIVDNDMRAADSLELMLNAAGYAETRVAYSAHAALAFAVEFHPDVAFVEMNLLDMDSNDLAQRLRERAQIHDLRLIAMTSSREHAGRDVARNAGFERYLLKPIGAADLSSLLDVHPQSGAISQG